MAYVCELGTGQNIYLENQGEQTAITSATSTPGQQQQSSSRFNTGRWIEPPQLFRSTRGITIKLLTTSGEILIQVQGQMMKVTQADLELQQAQRIEITQINAIPNLNMGTPMPPMPPLTMKPMEPMEPMKMGDMQMSFNPMQMQMGKMQMQMGTETSEEMISEQRPGATVQKFCTQCGQSVALSDRFCGSCGHKLRAEP